MEDVWEEVGKIIFGRRLRCRGLTSSMPTYLCIFGYATHIIVSACFNETVTNYTWWILLVPAPLFAFIFTWIFTAAIVYRYKRLAPPK
jgi:nucleoside recognition membrane protein YjiH